jgi:hypothetical protein
VTRRQQGLLGLAVLGLVAVLLIAVELGRGALDYGELSIEDPCTTQVDFEGGGLDGTVQTIALDGLNGAACELGTTREELVLSFDENRSDVQWDRETIEQAVRAGLLRSLDEAEARGDIGGLVALTAREIIERAPIDWLIEGGGSLLDLIG